ncbi:hypothetical protein C0Q70_09154 [Pomacea canaliculata]|uniref:G-protein coupled receptors family 1 profile domain-containing protein n=1 Tax=Pomacea canaliculata TaxID=400727 RepID=A0A2T7P8Z0_POMCA|nr:hypothetical protein C0Q70_09154 [Pomacea canaliculata]
MNNTNDTESELFQYYRTIEYQYYKVYIWVLVGVGVPGNVACILVTTSMTLTTATLYMSLLAVADLLALVLRLIFHQIAFYDVTVNTFVCKMEVFILLVSNYANWTLVLVCLERFLSIRFPLKKKIYFTKKRAILIAVLLGMILCLCHLYAFIQIDYKRVNTVIFRSLLLISQHLLVLDQILHRLFSTLCPAPHLSLSYHRQSEATTKGARGHGKDNPGYVRGDNADKS